MHLNFLTSRDRPCWVVFGQSRSPHMSARRLGDHLSNPVSTATSLVPLSTINILTGGAIFHWVHKHICSRALIKESKSPYLTLFSGEACAVTFLEKFVWPYEQVLHWPEKTRSPASSRYTSNSNDYFVFKSLSVPPWKSYKNYLPCVLDIDTTLKHPLTHSDK